MWSGSHKRMTPAMLFLELRQLSILHERSEQEDVITIPHVQTLAVPVHQSCIVACHHWY